MQKKYKKLNKGASTIEILIAFTVLILCLSAVSVVLFSNQSLSVDIRNNHEALYMSNKILEDTRSASKLDFLSVIPNTTTETSGEIIYTKTLSVWDVSQCKKQVKVSTTWWTSPLRPQKIELETYFADPFIALALGGDCITESPESKWDNPQRFALDTMTPSKPTSIDELNRLVYLGTDKAPFLAIADTKNAALGQNSGLFVSYTNGFNLGKQINSLDSVRYSSTGKTYVYAATNSATGQLAVIDVEDILKPTASFISLSPCVSGSEPEGWLVYFYKDKLYLTTRYTAGPEFHVFNVSDPTSITEISIGSSACKGFEVGDTINDLVVQDQIISGVTKRYAYLATSEVDKELRVLDVTNPLNIIEVNMANQNLPGAQNGLSVYAIGNKLYLGRQSTPSGPDLYIFDTTNPQMGLNLLGSKDINTGVLGIRIVGKFAFLTTPKTNQEFQVWDISDPSGITNISTFNSGNIVNRGIDFNPDFIYSAGQNTPNFQILYSP